MPKLVFVSCWFETLHSSPGRGSKSLLSYYGIIEGISGFCLTNFMYSFRGTTLTCSISMFSEASGISGITGGQNCVTTGAVPP